MLAAEQIAHFRTCGFVLCNGLLSQDEMTDLSKGFDAAMLRARAGGPPPMPGGPRQHVIPFFDYGPETFYPQMRHYHALVLLCGPHVAGRRP